MKLPLFFIFLSLQLSAVDPVAQISQQGQALFAAKQYEQASNLYEQLLNQSPPAWQKAILLYNLGTIQLAQNNREQALHLFHAIAPETISSPKLLRDLKFNEGFLNIRQAEAASSPEEAIYFLRNSLKNLKEAEKIDCQMQKLEESISSCLPAPDIQNLVKFVTLHLDQLEQKQQDHFLQQDESQAPPPKTPQQILQRALKQARQLLYLSQLSQDSTAHQESHSVLQDRILQILQGVQSFIPAVLALETERFQQIGKIVYPRCQDKPWDQVIPLFEEGHQTLSFVQKELKTASVHLDQQERAITAWQQALDLLEQGSSSERSALESSKPMHEVLDLLQQMEAADTPEKAKSPKEMQTW